MSEPITKNAVTCSICQSPADRYDNRFECQSNPCHVGDLNVGIFSDLTPPTEHILMSFVNDPTNFDYSPTMKEALGETA